MRTLAPRERKAVAILLLVAVLAMIQLLVIAPIIAGFGERATREATLRQRYQVNQRLIASIPRIRRQVEQHRERLQFFVLPAPNASVGSAALQARLQSAVEAVGGELRGTEEVTGEDGFVRARASTRLTLTQLTRLLALLQDRPPYLTIDMLSVTADQALISGKLEPLDSSLEVSIPIGRPAPH